MALTPLRMKPEQTEELILQNMGEDIPKSVDDGSDEQPAYRIFADSRIPISKAVGMMWKRRWEAATAAYDAVYQAWEEAFRYYNHNQTKDQVTTRGHFHRGDGAENIVYANVNTMVPAIYSKNPDVSCTTEDGEDEDFCRTLQSLINTLFRRKHAPGMSLKSRAKRATLMAELTNMGVLKLDFVDKEDSRDVALEEMADLKEELAKADDKKEVAEIEGKLKSLETLMEVGRPSGYTLSVVLPHKFIPDPYCENDDLSDADWTVEEAFLETAYLNAMFTEEGEDGQKMLVYKPTHQAKFKSDGAQDNDDGLGIILEAINGESSKPQSDMDEERLAYLYTYYTEVCWIWSKSAKQVYLFQKNDWTWPIWVWDDPLHLTRFFPYFVMQFTMSTGGLVSPGVVSYYLDQQDEINDINRQVAMLRRRVFDYYVYNSSVIEKDEAEKLIRALRSETATGKVVVGVRLDPSQKLEDVFGNVGVPSKDVQPFFDKGQAMQAADRISATSDALRGNQFKTNTTEDAVQAYVDATRLRIGAKVDVVEDVLADLAQAVAEIAVQKFDETAVADLIGKTKAAFWKSMDVAEFSSTYTVNIVAGSVEKPTSVFKKKEAVEVAQAIGQFAGAAPLASTMVALRVLEKAFSEVVIHREDWEAINAELKANAQAAATGGGGGPGGEGGEEAGGLDAATLQNLPPEIKQQVVLMKRQGKSDEEILAFIKEAVTKSGGGAVRARGEGGNGEASEY